LALCLSRQRGWSAAAPPKGNAGPDEQQLHRNADGGSHRRPGDLRRLALAYVNFALAHPGRFRLMFRPDLVDRDDPRYAAFSTRALSGFARAIERRHNATSDSLANVFVVWSSIHGMANLVLDGKAKYLFNCATPEQFVDQVLPGLLAETCPFGISG
jgi:hypothetical protein